MAVASTGLGVWSLLLFQTGTAPILAPHDMVPLVSARPMCSDLDLLLPPSFVCLVTNVARKIVAIVPCIL